MESVFRETCAYLPSRDALMEQVFLRGWGASHLDKLLSQGYRHFGDYFFRPQCRDCGLCLPVRVPVEEFRPNRREARILKNGAIFTVRLEDPVPGYRAFRIYQDHQQRFLQKGPSTYPEFVRSFYSDHPSAKQLVLLHKQELAGILHLDITSCIGSAVYAYYSSEYQRYSPGTLMILKALEIAKRLGLAYMYLGYYVPESPHMLYKHHFYPLEVLTGKNGWHCLRAGDGVWNAALREDARFHPDGGLNDCFRF